MSIGDVLLVEVRDATTHAVVATGTVKREPGALEQALGDTLRRLARHREKSGVAVVIRCPA